MNQEKDYRYFLGKKLPLLGLGFVEQFAGTGGKCSTLWRNKNTENIPDSV